MRWTVWYRSRFDCDLPFPCSCDREERFDSEKEARAFLSELSRGTKGVRLVRVLTHEEAKRKAAAEALRAFAQSIRNRFGDGRELVAAIANAAEQQAKVIWPLKVKP